MDDEIKPCPFCGGEAEFSYTPWDDDEQVGDDGTGWVVCQSCNVQIYGHTREDAIEKWNTRR
jgi:Lar family restriction alleviation protein